MSKYYLFSGDDGYDYRYLREMLKRAGIEPLPDSRFVKDGNLEYTREAVNVPSVYFLHIVPVGPDIPYDKNTYKIRANIQNLHHSDTIMTITYKDKLYAHMRGSKFIPQSWPMEEFKWMPGVYIMRPSNIVVCSGKDIIVVTTEKEFEDAKAIYAERAAAYQKFKSGPIKYYQVVVSEYIMNPLLFEGRKMHLRMYIIGTARGCKICRTADISTAALPYTQGDWQNERVHDTHFKSTPRDLYYPEDYPGDQSVLEPQLDELEAYLTDNFKFAPFETAEQSYQIFGADFMVEDGKLKVIEINSKPGMYRKEEHSEKTENFRRKIDQWIFDNISWMFE
jgi:hypothetical protein